jgi:hypothetical protein
LIQWRQTILSQFASSPKLVGLLDAINAWISPNANLEAFYQEVMDLDSAGEYGLAVWARIVNVPTVVTINSFPYFGFGEAGDRVGFGQGSFGDNYLDATLNYQLTGDVLRRFIYAKAAYNITNGSIPAINAILMDYLFPGRGNAWVTDGANGYRSNLFGFGEALDRVGFDQGPFGDDLMPTLANMTLTYVFTFPLYQYEAAMAQSGVLPKPTGVLASWDFQAGFIDG